MSKRLYTVQEMVRTQLEQRPETRNDDRQLIYNLYRDNFGIVNDKWVNVIFNRDLPNFESIRRCRQKLQAEDETLRPVEEVQEIRFQEQRNFIEYALGEELWI